MPGGSAIRRRTSAIFACVFASTAAHEAASSTRSLTDDFTTVTTWVGAWGHYSFTVPEGLAARVVLHVAEHSARDGAGVAVQFGA